MSRSTSRCAGSGSCARSVPSGAYPAGWPRSGTARAAWSAEPRRLVPKGPPRWTSHPALDRVRGRSLPRASCIMSFADRVRRVPTGVWVLLFAVALVLPALGSFGFWDPWELNIADRAREVGRAGNLLDPTAGGRYGGEPPLDLFLAALGMRLFGAHEL